MVELTERMWRVVIEARRALRATIERDYATDANTLTAVAVTGAFADLCAASSEPGVRDLVAVINHQLRDAGLELRPLRRN